MAAWKDTFNQLFGLSTDSSPTLTGTELMQAITFLHNAGTNLDSIDQLEKAQVDFWFDKVFGFTSMHDNVEDCNPEYLKRISEDYSRQNTGNNSNFEQIYLTFQRNIIGFCNRHFADLSSLLINDITTECKLVTLWDSYKKISDAHPTDLDSAKMLKKPVLQLIGVDKKANATRFQEAWSNGPCQVISSTLLRPEMKQYSDFVDMYLLGSKDLLLLCPESIRQWVNIVDMCRHLDTLIPQLIENIDAEARQAEELWKKLYNQMFAQNPRASTMSLQRMLHSLMYLHAKVDRLTSVDESQKEIVNIWFDSLIELDAYDCNVDYVQRMTDIYHQQNHSDNPNFRLVYTSFRKTLIDFCDGCFSEIPEYLATRVSDGNLLNYLERQVIHNEVLSPNDISSNQDLAERLADCAIKSCEAGKRGTDVMHDWKLGPCEELQTVLREPSMQPYCDFIDLSLLDEGEYLKYCYAPNYVWIRVVHMCRILDRWMLHFAENDFLASIVRPLIRHNFGINSLDDMMKKPIPTAGPSRNSSAEQGTTAEPPEERVIRVVSTSPVTRSVDRPRSTSAGSTLSPLMRNRNRRGNPLLTRYRGI